MKVNEIFVSIQGEGRLAGVVSVFVRLAGCDLHCRWCDTPYARRPDQGRDMSVAEIIEQVDSHDCAHVVVTGGEPLIAPQLPALLGGLKARDRHVTLETAARQYRPIVCDLVSISPKLTHAQLDEESKPNVGAEPHVNAGAEPRTRPGVAIETDRLNIKAIRNFIEEHDYQLKFVIRDEDDLTEVEDILNQLPAVPKDRVLLMPLARTQSEHRRRGPLVAELCRAQGYRYCPRLQVELWDNRRGC